MEDTSTECIEKEHTEKEQKVACDTKPSAGSLAGIKLILQNHGDNALFLAHNITLQLIPVANVVIYLLCHAA